MKELFSRTILSALVMIVTLFSSGGLAAAANPAACPTPGSSKAQVLNGVGETGNGCDPRGVDSVIHAVVNILSLLVGAIAVIIIILGGFKYITSGGDSNKVANAKSTVVYALIGVAIAALAQVLIHFVLFQTDKAVG